MKTKLGKNKITAIIKYSYYKGRNDELDEIQSNKKVFPEIEIKKIIDRFINV